MESVLFSSKKSTYFLTGQIIPLSKHINNGEIGS